MSEKKLPTKAERIKFSIIMSKYRLVNLKIEQHEATLNQLHAEAAATTNKLRHLDREKKEILAEIDDWIAKKFD